MRKSTLFIAGALMASSLTAQTAQESLWSEAQTSNLTFEEGKSELVSTPTAVSADGDSYFAGVFNQDFSFAGEDFTPEFGKNAYIKKYDKAGNEEWAVTLAGAATIKQMKTAENGNIFVAGTLADLVIVNSTDGAFKEIEGFAAADGSFGTAKSASFVAEYTSAGVLLDVNTFISKEIQALNDLGYSYADGDVFFDIKQLEVVGNEAYISALFTGQYAQGSVDITSSYYNFFGFIFGYSQGGLIIGLGENLEPNKLVASVVDSESQILDKQTILKDVAFGVNEGVLTGAIIATDSRSIVVGGTTIPFDMTNNGDGFLGYGHQIFTYDISTSSLVEDAIYEVVTDDSNVDIDVENIFSLEGQVYLSGHFSGTSAFNSNVASTSKADLFVVALNQTTLSPEWVSVSGVNEGDPLKESEKIASVVVSDRNAYLFGYTYTTNSDVMISPVLMQVALDGGSATVSQSGNFVTGAAVNNTMFAKSETTITKGVVSNTYSLATVVPASIEDVKGDEIASIYPTQTSDIINFSNVVDVEVYDLTGSLVYSAKQVESISIAHLMEGSYLVKAITKDGQNVVKVIKQ